ncbi:MAG: hypothetical protein JSV94_00560 [Methanobacteriota archaeon]|nr:MAG: hypothetical protein JSV94_00560 [Euryarchaeota archaeon]
MVGLDITPQMTSKWVKAAFLILVGFVLLFYSDGFVDDLERNSADEFDISFEWTWDLLRVLIWILIAWLFVDAVLIVVLSFKIQIYSIDDVVARLKVIEKKLQLQDARLSAMVSEPEQEMYSAVEAIEETDELDPPPPVE